MAEEEARFTPAINKAPVLGTALFTAGSLAVATGLVLLGRYLYTLSAGQPADLFHPKLAELVLQLAAVVVIGALLKVVMKWGTSQRARYVERLEAQREFLRRVRAMHVTIQTARNLINAHRSGKTWVEQSQRLMTLRHEVEEISEDLQAVPELFASQAEIVDGLEVIVEYLAKAGEEYIRSHDFVDKDARSGNSLSAMMTEHNMPWVHDFMEAGEEYKKDYEATLVKLKKTMREQVYGSLSPSAGQRDKAVGAAA